MTTPAIVLPVGEPRLAPLKNATHCKRGHPFDEANTLTYASTGAKRMCRICTTDRLARRPRPRVSVEMLGHWKTVPRVCSYCGGEFLPTGVIQKFCSKQHAFVAARKARYAKQRQLTPEDLAKKAAQSRQWRIDNKAQFKVLTRRATLKKRYGLTPEQVADLYRTQDGRCAICGGDGRRLVIDHDHRTGLVRGLLCDGCNTTLHLLEDPERLAAALAYLQIPTRYLEVLTA